MRTYKLSIVLFMHGIFVTSAFPQMAPINWKPFFTLTPTEGTSFVADSTAIIPNAGVPGINIANDGRVILGWGTNNGGGRRAGFTNDTGRTFTPFTGIQQPMHVDGGFIYFPDGRTRFITEEPLPNHPQQPHKSHIISWMSSDGLNWTREAGVRFQPGLADDSISAVPSILQVSDSIWRMYYVADWYRTNGIRTAISTDWGLTWVPESIVNVLRNGDVDPHPVYLTNGQIRLYHRRSLPQSGVAFTDGNGVVFDTTTTQLLIADGSGFTALKLDPAVIKYPNGRVACYMGAAPFMGQTDPPKLIAAWANGSTAVGEGEGKIIPSQFHLEQNYPNPFNPTTTISYTIASNGNVRLNVYNLLGEEIRRLADEFKSGGAYSITWDGTNQLGEPVSSGVYFYRLHSGDRFEVRKMVLTR